MKHNYVNLKTFSILSSILLGKRQNFDEMVDFRKKEARASVVIQVGNPSKSVTLVNKVCSRHGDVKKIFHYSHRDKVTNYHIMLLITKLLFYVFYIKMFTGIASARVRF